MSTEISWNGDSSFNDDEIANQTVDDANQLLADEAALQESQAALEASLTDPTLGSDEGLTYVVMNVFILMLQEIECAIKVESDYMALGIDMKNLTLGAQDGFNAMLAPEPQKEDYATTEEYNAAHDEWEADQQEGAETLVEDMNLLLGTSPAQDQYCFTITTTAPDGSTTTQTANGLLDLLSNPDYWPTGAAPMSESDAQTIEAEGESIIATIGQANWNTATGDPNANPPVAPNYKPLINEVYGWGNSEAVDSEGNVNDQSGNQEDTVNSSFSEMLASEDQQYQKMETYLQMLMNYYDSAADSMNTMSDDLTQMQEKMLGQMGQ